MHRVVAVARVRRERSLDLNRRMIDALGDQIPLRFMERVVQVVVVGHLDHQKFKFPLQINLNTHATQYYPSLVRNTIQFGSSGKYVYKVYMEIEQPFLQRLVGMLLLLQCNIETNGKPV